MRRFAILLCLAMVALATLGCGGSEDVVSTTNEATTVSTSASSPATTAPTTALGPPLIDTIAVAPTVIDVPYARRFFAVTAEAGGAATCGDAMVVVPAGAVSQETTVEIRRLLFPFHSEEFPESPPPDAAIGLGEAYDLGPAGLVFDKPVTVTLPYDEAKFPAGFSEDNVKLAYWNGAEWFVCQALVDREKNTATAQFERFDGLVVELILATIIGVTYKHIYNTATNPERISSDAVMERKASQWITPKDPAVQQRALQAVIRNDKTKEIKQLNDPNLGTWMADAAKNRQLTTLVYQDPKEGLIEHTYDDGTGSNWQKPSDYFTKGTVIRPDKLGQSKGGPFWGDCTDTTNAVVSVLKARGFKSQAVYGYRDGNTSKPHVWGEVLIGDRVYRVDFNGDFVSPEFDETGHYTMYRPVTDPNDPCYNSTWDDEGQEPYDEDWEQESEFADFAGTYKGSFPGGDPWGEIPFEFAVDETGGLEGGFDFVKSLGGSYAMTFTGSLMGSVFQDGKVEAKGLAEATVDGETGSNTVTAGIILQGTISDGVFIGTLKGDKGPTSATAKRQ